MAPHRSHNSHKSLTLELGSTKPGWITKETGHGWWVGLRAEGLEGNSWVSQSNLEKPMDPGETPLVCSSVWPSGSGDCRWVTSPFRAQFTSINTANGAFVKVKSFYEIISQKQTQCLQIRVPNRSWLCVALCKMPCSESSSTLRCSVCVQSAWVALSLHESAKRQRERGAGIRDSVINTRAACPGSWPCPFLSQRPPLFLSLDCKNPPPTHTKAP